MDLQMFENNLKQLETNVIIAKAKENTIKNEINSIKSKIQNKENENIELEKVITILTSTATTVRDNARKHFEEIITKFDINRDEVLVVGNDAIEDLCCKKVGLLNTYLITDNLLHPEEKEEAKYISSSKEFLEFVSNLPEIN